ncbi:MAG TPA: tetratricopeptide repeat protein, partial [Pyrinomonadaceae bacterium]|nr:tetratricopeptide repeat protein [Pyrinomonadaceae bacterium]
MIKTFSTVTFLLMLLTSVSAQAPSRDMEKEKPIWAELQTIAPDSVENFKAATAAMDSDNYEEAARLYEEVRKKAPDFPPVLRRLGMSLVHSGKTESGFQFLERAVEIDRSPDNLFSLAWTLAYPRPGQEGTREQKWRALQLLKEAVRSPKSDGDDLALLAQLALDLDQIDDFRRSTESLVAKYPDL